MLCYTCIIGPILIDPDRAEEYLEYSHHVKYEQNTLSVTQIR